MKTGVYVTACLITAGLIVFAPSSQGADTSEQFPCFDDPSSAVSRAQAALDTKNPQDDRAALACLADAVAGLDARLRGLSSGTLPFGGQIYAPKGVSITKPLTSEAR